MTEKTIACMYCGKHIAKEKAIHTTYSTTGDTKKIVLCPECNDGTSDAVRKANEL